MRYSFWGFLFRNRTKNGREDNLLSLLDDGTNPTEASDNLGYQVHGVLQKFLLYLTQNGK